jgi:isocitrate dehydrogenase
MGVDKIRFPETSSFGIKPVSKEGSERLIRAAIHYAIQRSLPFVTIVHKGNIMKFTEGAFKNWGYDLAESEFADQTFTWRQYEKIKKEKSQADAESALNEAKKAEKVIIKDVITDAFLQESLLRPYDHSVIATMNLNGDYISDQLAAMVGGIGISPGANINYKSGYAIFEATHGTAPNIAGTGQANPKFSHTFGVMMLEYMGWDKAAEHIYDAMEHTFAKRRVTSDLFAQMEGATLLSTSEFADEIIKNMHIKNKLTDNDMEYIKNRFYEKALKCQAEFQRIRKDHGDVVLGQVTIDQVLSGMKGIPALLTETSKLDANEGIRFKGYSIQELRQKLPNLMMKVNHFLKDYFI